MNENVKSIVTVETRVIPLKDVHVNPKNPRLIKDEQYRRLVKSLREFPEMLSIRELVVDETMMILGGNMRYRALLEIGAKKAPVRIVRGLTAEQKREFIVKDNAAFGKWDWDTLANEWDDVPLADWGVDLPEDWAGPARDLAEGDIEEWEYSEVNVPFWCVVRGPLEKLLEVKAALAAVEGLHTEYSR